MFVILSLPSVVFTEMTLSQWLPSFVVCRLGRIRQNDVMCGFWLTRGIARHACSRNLFCNWRINIRRYYRRDARFRHYPPPKRSAVAMVPPALAPMMEHHRPKLRTYYCWILFFVAIARCIPQPNAKHVRNPRSRHIGTNQTVQPFPIAQAWYEEWDETIIVIGISSSRQVLRLINNPGCCWRVLNRCAVK